MTRILVVDDSDENRYLLETILNGYGYTVDSAKSGEEALKSARKTPPGLVITDILMPVMDGFMLCRKWKADKRLKQIPFVFFTATYSDPRDEKFALSLGADLYIVKPQEPEKLVMMLKKVIKKYENGRHVVSEKLHVDEVEFLKQHNRVLFRKLEKKIDDLEIDNQKRILAENALRESERRLSLHIQNTPVAVIEWNTEFCVTSWNPAAEMIFGYSVAEALGQYASIIVPDSIKQYIDEVFSKLLLQQGGEHSINENVTKDGRNIICEWYNTPLISEDGAVSGVASMALDVTERMRAEEEKAKFVERLKKTLDGTVNALSAVGEHRDPYTAGHQERVTKLACAIAEEMELSPEICEDVRIAGKLHDIGKIEVPSEILSKPGKLTDIEFSIIKVHPNVGYDILKEAELPYDVIETVLEHHERLDGSGYPQGLKADAISIGAKIMSVADVVEAMSSHRPYRPALGIELALEEIEKKRGKLYDSAVVNDCVKLFREKGFKF